MKMPKSSKKKHIAWFFFNNNQYIKTYCGLIMEENSSGYVNRRWEHKQATCKSCKRIAEK